MLAYVERISVSPVFVARSAELAELAAALERAEAGQPQALLIAGDAGVGKTRLLEEFQTLATGRGAVFALGGCVEIGADGLPFAPVVAALRALVHELPAEAEAAVAGSESQLVQFLPELGRLPVSAGAHDEYGRARLFEHTARFFERLAADRTLVLALEDLHWSDRSTRELLVFLLRSLRTARIVIVGSYRSDDLHRRHPLRPFLADLERMRTVQRIELGRLARPEVAQQLTGILSEPPGAGLLDRIYRRSEGNPFFVEELAASYQQGCSSGLTDSLRDVLMARVETLPERVQTVLRALAQGGSSVEYPLLEAVLELSEDELIPALRTAVDANILRPSAAGNGYCFRHALVREAVADDLLPGEGSRIKRRYATVVSDRPQLIPADQRITRLANYWYSAGDPARALPAALDAGREARTRNAFAEQLQMLERVLELWDRAPDEVKQLLRPADYVPSYPPYTGEALLAVDVYAEAAVAARFSGDRERCLSMCRQALRMVDESADPERAAWFLVLMARIGYNSNRDGGRAELMHARGLVEHRPPSAVQAEVFGRLAALAMIDGATDEELALTERAVRIACEVGAEAAELHARCTLSVLLTVLGREDEGIGQLQLVLERALELQEPDLMCRAYINLADAYEGLGRSAEAVRVGRAGYRMVRDGGLFGVAGPLMTGNLVESLLSLGGFEEAAALLEEPIETGPVGDLRFLSRLRAVLAFLRDDLPGAGRWLGEAMSHAAAGRIESLIPFHELSIRLATADGRFADARAGLLAALDEDFGPTSARYAWPLLVHGTAAEADSRGLPALEADRPAVLARVRAAAAQLPTRWPLVEGWSLLLDAELARAEGAPDPVLQRRAVEVLETSGLPYPLDLALLRAAEAEAGHGDRAAAAVLLRRAEQAALHHGDLRLQRDAALFADRARLREPEPAGRAAAAAAHPEGPAFGLTPRELVVLRLVAEGRTNRQIADELYISPKTASVHVSNILAKLEVGGRGEAAALAHRLHLFAPVPGLAD